MLHLVFERALLSSSRIFKIWTSLSKIAARGLVHGAMTGEYKHMDRSFCMEIRKARTSVQQVGGVLSRCEKTIPAQQRFNSLRVWEKDGIFPQSLEQSSSKSDRLIEGAEH